MSQAFRLRGAAAAILLAAGAAWSAGAAAADGVFEGSAQGIASAVKATVTVKDGRIAGVTLDTSGETAGYGRGIADEMAKRILERGGANVDGVSGATVTSRAAKLAVEEALAQAGLVEKKVSSALKPGVYTGRAHGAKSMITVEIAVDDGGRATIAKIEKGDTPYISDIAAERVKAEFEAGQTLAVDAVAGATLTSRGIAEAAGNALAQAGADLSAWMRRAPARAVRHADEEADVVVVGGGAAGMAAAIAAKRGANLNGTQNGLKVVLVETKDYLGGDLAICGGYVAAYRGTMINDEAGVSIDPETVVAATKAAKTPEAAAMMNDALAVRVVDHVEPTLRNLIAQGFRIERADATVGSTNSPYFKDGVMHYGVARTSDADTGYRSIDAGYDTTSGSPWMAKTLAAIVERSGVDVRLGSTVEDVLLQNGRASAVRVKSGGAEYTIRAKAVVLATGYSGLDHESVRLFYPQLEGVVRTGGAGVDSFAPKWILRQGGKAAVNPASSTLLGYDAVLGIDGPESEIYQRMTLPWVNVTGRRFMSESGHPGIWELDPEARGRTDAVRVIRNLPATGRPVAKLLEQPGKCAWMIFDDASPAAKHVPHLAESNLAWSADTLEALAVKAGIADPKAFRETIERYNADYEAGKDSAFGTARAEMTPVLRAPFHAVKVRAVNTIANATCYADDDLAILTGPKAAGGKRIEGLFGAGGAIGNAITNTGLGAHNATALSSGALAGAEAAACAQKSGDRE